MHINCCSPTVYQCFDMYRSHIPSVIAVSRQKFAANLEGTSLYGVYVINHSSVNGLLDIILIGTGSELCLCEGRA